MITKAVIAELINNISTYTLVNILNGIDNGDISSEEGIQEIYSLLEASNGKT